MTMRWMRQGMAYQGPSYQAQSGCEVSSVTTSLRMLFKCDLDSTKVTDGGLEHLKGLTQLQRCRSKAPR